MIIILSFDLDLDRATLEKHEHASNEYDLKIHHAIRSSRFASNATDHMWADAFENVK